MTDPERLLTPAELELMQVLWREGAATVADVSRALGDGRAYTTVATLLKILEQKGFLTSSTEGRRLVYAPVAPRERYERRSVRSLVEAVFGGDRSALLRTLVGEAPLRPEEVEALQQALDRARSGS